MSTSAAAMAPEISRRVAWAWLALATFLNIIGNYLLKFAALEGGLSIDLFLTPAFWAAGVTFGVAFFVYVKALSGLKLSVAYPVMVGGSLVAIAAASMLWFGESLGPIQFIGMALVFLGISLVSNGEHQ